MKTLGYFKQFFLAPLFLLVGCSEFTDQPQTSLQNKMEIRRNFDQNFDFEEISTLKLLWDQYYEDSSDSSTRYFEVPFSVSFDSANLEHAYKYIGTISNREIKESFVVAVHTFEESVKYNDLRSPVFHRHSKFDGILYYYYLDGEFSHWEIYKEGQMQNQGNRALNYDGSIPKQQDFSNLSMQDPSCNEVSTTTCTRGCWYWDYGGSREYFNCTPWSCTTTVVDPCTGGGGGGPSSINYSTADKNGFKYPPNSGYEDLYPKLTEYLKNKMPLLKTNYAITTAIMNITGLTLTEIQEDLEWGEGPTIIVQQLGTDQNGSEIYGQFDATHPNNLFIDIDLVNDMENSVPGTMDANGLAFLMGVSILHEYVHFGDYVDGNTYPGEEGVIFEQTVYGQTVWRHNAKTILTGN
ncbi:hypothetical protein [Algoriphagus halophytocola]|uniref:Tox-MPTase3 domain-containing protein n=1 Tax=Algoriphagus halophytocola TaxID=2991499 RepID=A0ABY6MDM6_9BACT|nr:hypothetical protein [Algoriphagus sp. TR-M5]UZD21857.1 hypothetical protein OM944_14415 [Algoriphagus sp. TR-M5]